MEFLISLPENRHRGEMRKSERLRPRLLGKPLAPSTDQPRATEPCPDGFPRKSVQNCHGTPEVSAKDCHHHGWSNSGCFSRPSPGTSPGRGLSLYPQLTKWDDRFGGTAPYRVPQLVYATVPFDAEIRHWQSTFVVDISDTFDRKLNPSGHTLHSSTRLNTPW